MPERRVSVEVEMTGSNKMGSKGGGIAGPGAGSVGGVPTVAAAGPSLLVANQMKLLGQDLAKLRGAIVAPPVVAGAGRAMGWLRAGPSLEQQKAVGPDIAAGFKDIALGLGIATAAASGFMASMAPMTFSTLTGSVQLLGGQFATLLIPAFSMASLKIQQLTGWVASLDDSTKGMISSTAMWVAPGMVALGVLGAMAPVLRLVTGGVILLTTALWTAGRAALAFVLTPWGAGLTAIAVTVGILTNGFGLLGDSIARSGQRADDARERIARLAQPGAQLTRSDYLTVPVNVRERLEAAAPERRASIIQSEITSLERRRDNILLTQPSRLQTAIEGRLEAIDAGAALAGGRPRGESRAIAIQEELERARILPGRAATIVQGLRESGGLGSVLAQSPEERQRLAAAGARIPQMTTLQAGVDVLTNVLQQGIPGIFEGLRTSTPMQGQMYSSGADAYYSVVQDVLARGQLEQDILRAIMENTARMVALASGQQNGGVAVAPIPQPGAAPP